MNSLQIINRQKTRRIDARRFRRAAGVLLDDLLDLCGYEMAVHFLDAKQMAQANEQFLDHHGSTDVITFDYNEGYTELGPSAGTLRGEILISVDDAVSQAHQFKTRWQEEVSRYFIHGVLHLLGYDDVSPAKRTIMKREENKLLRRLAAQCDLAMLSR